MTGEEDMEKLVSKKADESRRRDWENEQDHKRRADEKLVQRAALLEDLLRRMMVEVYRKGAKDLIHAFSGLLEQSGVAHQEFKPQDLVGELP